MGSERPRKKPGFRSRKPAPDQKAWMDRMIKEGKIAIPPGGTLEKGSLYSMFVRMLLHNAMEEQKRQEVLDAEDEDDDE